MNILFVCNQGKHRSRTAAALFAGEYATDFAGTYNNLVTKEQLAKADLVIVMEEQQRRDIGRMFPALYLQKQIMCLHISDAYQYMQPELCLLLKERVRPLVKLS